MPTRQRSSRGGPPSVAPADRSLRTRTEDDEAACRRQQIGSAEIRTATKVVAHLPRSIELAIANLP